MIDLLRYVGGEIVSINGVVDNVIYKSEVEDFACAIVKFENGGYGFSMYHLIVKNLSTELKYLAIKVR